LKNDKIKIADLGTAKNLEGTLARTSNQGTRIYSSPEMYQLSIGDTTINITFKTDVWSAGIVFYELITFERPFTLNELFKETNLKAPNLHPDLPCLFQSLINA